MNVGHRLSVEKYLLNNRPNAIAFKAKNLLKVWIHIIIL